MVRAMDDVIRGRMAALMAEGYTEDEALEEAECSERCDFERALEEIGRAEYCCFRYENGRDYEDHGLDFGGIEGIIVVDDDDVRVDDEFFTEDHVVALRGAIDDEIRRYRKEYGWR